MYKYKSLTQKQMILITSLHEKSHAASRSCVDRRAHNLVRIKGCHLCVNIYLKFQLFHNVSLFIYLQQSKRKETDQKSIDLYTSIYKEKNPNSVDLIFISVHPALHLVKCRTFRSSQWARGQYMCVGVCA